MISTLKVTQKKSAVPGRKIDSPASAFAAMKFLLKQDREKFYVLHLNAQLQLLGRELIAQGSLTNATVHPREVFKGAILNNSACILLAHNHPSGSAVPSSDDLAITDKLIMAGRLLGIPVNDHIIVGQGHYYSFVEERDGSRESGKALTESSSMLSRNASEEMKTVLDLSREAEDIMGRLEFIRVSAINLMEKAEGIRDQTIMGFQTLMFKLEEEINWIVREFKKLCSIEDTFDRAKDAIALTEEGSWTTRAAARESLEKGILGLKRVVDYCTKRGAEAEDILKRATALLMAY